MKKLMIAMTAVASFALVAKSATTLGVDEDFSTRTEGRFYDAEHETYPADSDKTRWFCTDTEHSESTIEAASEDGQHKYLHIDEAGILTREIGAATDIPLDGHIDIDAAVQFTAIDWTGDSDNPALDEGAKLALWLKKTPNGDGTESTTLMVTALDTASGKAVPFDTGKVLDENKWYGLKAISKAVEVTKGYPSAVFTIEIDNEPIGGTYTSLVTAGSGNAGTISSIGFKGTGAVDSIAFSSDVDEQPVEVTVVVDPEETPLTSLSYAIDGGTGVDVDVENPVFQVLMSEIKEKITIKATADGFEDYVGDFTKDQLEGGEVTITLTKKEGPTPVTPTVDLPANCSWVDGKAPLAEYAVGSTIDPKALAATTTTAHKKAVVTVKVNGSVITEEYTVQAGDEITITVSEEDITFTLTIPEVEHATADKTTGPVVEGTEVTITWTAEEGYKITAGATQTITVTADVEAAKPTVEEDSGEEVPDVIKGGSKDQQEKYAEWAKENGVVGNTDPKLADAFALGVAPAEAQKKLETIIDAKNLLATQILAKELTADGESFTVEGYPNATFKFVKVTTITTDANLFKLTVSFRSAN